MNRLLIVRHAQTRIDPDRPSHQWDLDPAGAQRLAALAALPCFGGAYRVASSSEPKAVKTAEAIIRQHGLPPAELCDDLREIRKGGFVGDRHDEITAQFFREPDRSPWEGWETAASALARFASCVDRLVAQAVGRDLIVVTHGTVVSLYMAKLQGQRRADPADWRAIGMPDLAVVDSERMRVIQPFGVWLA